MATWPKYKTNVIHPRMLPTRVFTYSDIDCKSQKQVYIGSIPNYGLRIKSQAKSAVTKLFGSR